MNIALPAATDSSAPSREYLLHSLYEAAELEHTLMCTYLYAAFSLKDAGDGLRAEELQAVTRWRHEIIAVAIEEMSHLTAVWNITAAIGGAPRIGRMNFPLAMGLLPAGLVVKLAPFNQSTLQHFIFLERPEDSQEPEGEGFAPERSFSRSQLAPRLTPMGVDYDTVGAFYSALGDGLRRFTDAHGESVVFCGEPALQISSHEVTLAGAKPVLCLKTALAAFDAIVLQGEGAKREVAGSHFQRFVHLRSEYEALRHANPAFSPAHPAATNPVLRRPPQPEGRVWVEDSRAASVVDLANASYALMLRMLAYVYTVPSPSAEKAAVTDIALGLMRATTWLGEEAARLPAGPSNPQQNAGMSFTALRDSSPLPIGLPARRFFIERMGEIAHAATVLREEGATRRVVDAANVLQSLSMRAARDLDPAMPSASPVPKHIAPDPTPASAPAIDNVASTIADGVETVEGKALTLHFEAKRCIHARFCVTGAPNVFLANVKGPWLHPDAMDAERLAEIAHACPSGAIRYARKDGRPDEAAPPVNLIGVREAGPYAVRAALVLDGNPIGYRATLCRCGASNNKPFCDGSHHDAHFDASGEPATGLGDRNTAMLPVRDGVLAIDAEPNGPLSVRGNMEILAGTGRMVCRLTAARLCRCDASATKPFCDGSHARIGFRS
jgi:CDGSH-type Zn-finger protein/uncharacterized Fe-S cluster protein YjdI